MYNIETNCFIKSAESLRRKAIGLVKWQSVAVFKMHCLKRQCFFTVEQRQFKNKNGERQVKGAI